MGLEDGSPRWFSKLGLWGDCLSGTGIKSQGLNPFSLRKELGIRVPSELEFPHSTGRWRRYSRWSSWRACVSDSRGLVLGGPPSLAGGVGRSRSDSVVCVLPGRSFSTYMWLQVQHVCGGSKFWVFLRWCRPNARDRAGGFESEVRPRGLPGVNEHQLLFMSRWFMDHRLRNFPEQ